MQPLSAGVFGPSAAVTRASLAYSLVQSLGLQNKAQQVPNTVTVEVDGKRIPIDDAAQIPAGLAGYVQVALDMNIINAFYTVTQGPYDLLPKLHATFKPLQKVKRADFAVIVTRTHDQWNSKPLDAVASQSATTTSDAQFAQRELVVAAPNPFSDRTRFSYQLAEPGMVSLEVFDMMGRKVKTVVNGEQGAGWHEQAFDGTALPAGTYLFKLRAGNKNHSGRVVLSR
jgi:serine protease AprX